MLPFSLFSTFLLDVLERQRPLSTKVYLAWHSVGALAEVALVIVEVNWHFWFFGQSANCHRHISGWLGDVPTGPLIPVAAMGLHSSCGDSSLEGREVVNSFRAPPLPPTSCKCISELPALWIISHQGPGLN